MIELLLSRGADVLAKSDIGLSPLIMAADKGYGDAVRLVLRYAADPNQRYSKGRTPLMSAAAQAHTDVVETLLTNRADVNARSDDGHSALLFAMESGLRDGLVCPIEGDEVEKADLAATVDCLLQAQANPNDAGPGGRTPLHLACTGGNAAIVERLCTVGASLQALDEEGRTPLQIAIELGCMEVLHTLGSISAECKAESMAAFESSPFLRHRYMLQSCSCWAWLDCFGS